LLISIVYNRSVHTDVKNGVVKYFVLKKIDSFARKVATFLVVGLVVGLGEVAETVVVWRKIMIVMM